MLVVPFDIANLKLALPLARVARIEPMVELAPLPRAMPNVAGGVVYAGSLLPIYELRAKLGRDPREARAADQLLLAYARGQLVGIVADATAAVTEIADFSEDGRSTAGILAEGGTISGAAIIDGRVVLITDLDAFLDDAQALELDAILREFNA
ncbi:MAG TPA: chemotaxis protein CheW [Ancylobacter sp.]